MLKMNICGKFYEKTCELKNTSRIIDYYGDIVGDNGIVSMDNELEILSTLLILLEMRINLRKIMVYEK